MFYISIITYALRLYPTFRKTGPDYTGYTSNLETRLEFHENAENHKFTYNADDWKLAFSLRCDSKQQALAIEKHIKAMKSKTYIRNLIQYPEMSKKLIEKYTPKAG